MMPTSEIIGSGAAVAAMLFAFFSSAFLAAQPDPAPVILRCYAGGQVIASAPSVDDFQLRQRGQFLEAHWTNPTTREREILVATTPCLYRVTSPPAEARPAQ